MQRGYLLSAFLILVDLAESHHPWAVPLGLLYKTFLQKFFVGGLCSDSGPNMAGLLGVQGL